MVITLTIVIATVTETIVRQNITIAIVFVCLERSPIRAS